MLSNPYRYDNNNVRNKQLLKPSLKQLKIQIIIPKYLIHIRQSWWNNAILPFHYFLYACMSVLLQTFFCTSFIWVPSLQSVFPFFFKHSTSSDHAKSMKSHMYSTFETLLASIISRSIGTTLKGWSLFNGYIHICHRSPISEDHTSSYRSTSCGSLLRLFL